ncbi:MAG: DUF1611 domain-containing protein [Bacteroidota bacterium]
MIENPKEKNNKPMACIITGGLLDDIHAKTAHGLIRRSERYTICGIIDEKNAGQEAGEILDGRNRGIQVYESIKSLINEQGESPEFAIIGMATHGGVIHEELYPTIREVLENKISIVNGLHHSLSDIDEFASLAKQSSAQIIDIRKPKPFKELHFWTGKIKEVESLKLAVLGTDCAVGKRTTARFLESGLNDHNIKTQMIYTGQTGWLQGGKHGLIFDAIPNDFVSGEIEHAMYNCWQEDKPEVMILEGQSSLRNPSGPCGTEFLLSGNLDGIILQHHPGRSHFEGLEDYPATMITPESEIELIKLFGVETLAVTLNTADMNIDEVRTYQKGLQEKLAIPVICPLEDGILSLIEVVKQQLVK